MIGKNWAMTHPYGKNKIWRTLKWGLQRFWRGWDETMPDNATAWTLEFIQKTCDDRLANQWTTPYLGASRLHTDEEWRKELEHGKELARRASLAYWNNWEELGYEIDDVMEEHKERARLIREATYWWHEQLAQDRFND